MCRSFSSACCQIFNECFGRFVIGISTSSWMNRFRPPGVRETKFDQNGGAYRVWPPRAELAVHWGSFTCNGMQTRLVMKHVLSFVKFLGPDAGMTHQMDKAWLSKQVMNKMKSNFQSLETRDKRSRPLNFATCALRSVDVRAFTTFSFIQTSISKLISPFFRREVRLVFTVT